MKKSNIILGTAQLINGYGINKSKISDNELNISQTPSLTTDSSGSLRPFATGSKFRSYVTTIGLYNEANELLMVGKLGQPIPMSNNTDTTFIIRYDQ